MGCSVIVKQVMPANMIIVYNCDYGDIAMLKLGDLRPLPKYCFNLPQLAISAKLHGRFSCLIMIMKRLQNSLRHFETI